MWQASRAFVGAVLLLCLLASRAAANQRLPEWTYDDVSQTLTFLDSTGSPVQLGTVNPSTHAIALATGGGVISTVPGGGTGVTSFSANLPLIGNGAGALQQGTRSGSTTTFATASGALTNGHCVSIDGSGNFVDAGGACTTGGAGGVVNSGLINQLAYYASAGTAVSGLATAASSVLTTGAGSVPAWAATLPCANVAAVSGDVTGSSGSCSGRTVTGVQGVAVGTPTGTTSSGVVLATAPTISQPVIMGDTSAATNAAAGQVGEVLSITSSPVSLTSSVTSNVVSKSITAGHWMCGGQGQAVPSGGSVTGSVMTLSTSTGVLGVAPFFAQTGAGQGTGATVTANTGTWLFNTSTTVTLFAVANVTVSGGTVTDTATIQCTRIW